MDMAGNAYDRVMMERGGQTAPVMVKGGSWLSPHPLNLRVLDMCVQAMGVADRSVGFRVVIKDKDPGRRTYREPIKPKLNCETDWMDAVDRAQTERKPIFLSLQYDTCGQCDRLRAQLFKDARFIKYCNKNMVVVVGHHPGDAGMNPHPEGKDGACPLYPGMACWEHVSLFRQAIRVVKSFAVSPGNFVLHPDHAHPGAGEKALLVPEGKLSKWGGDVEGYLYQFSVAAARLKAEDAKADTDGEQGAAAVNEDGEPKKSSKRVNGRLRVREGQPLLELWGTPHDQGYAHGFLLADKIKECADEDFAGPFKSMVPMYNTAVRNVVVPQFKFTEDELAELKGLYEGIRDRLGDDALFMKSLGHKIDLRDLKAVNTFGDWYGLGCSTVAVWGKHTKDGKTLIGRNFDFPAFALVQKHQMLVARYGEDDKLKSLAVTHPGSIGALTGMNLKGRFVSIHDVKVKPKLPQAMRPNAPRLMVIRRLLETELGKKPVERAHELCVGWPTLYGNNIMVVAGTHDNEGAVAGTVEYDGRLEHDQGATLRVADPEREEFSDCLACTNDHLVRADKVMNGPTACWRYPILIGGLASDESPTALDAPSLFKRMERVSFPWNDKPLARATILKGVKATPGFGTLHQVVAEPEQARMSVKLAKIGKRLRDVDPTTWELATLKAPTGDAEPAAGASSK